MIAFSWLSVDHLKMMLYEDSALTTRNSIIAIMAYGALPTITRRVMASIGKRASPEKLLSALWVGGSYSGYIPIFSKALWNKKYVELPLMTNTLCVVKLC